MRVSRVRRRSRHWVRGARLPDCSAPQLFVDASNDAYWGTEWGETHTYEHDLDFKTLIFTPGTMDDDGAATGYSFEVYDTNCYVDDPADSTTAINLNLGDDNITKISIGDYASSSTFSFYGTSYEHLWVSANGYITFAENEHQAAGDKFDYQNDENSDYAENIYDHFDAPRISVLYDDLIDTMYGTPGYADLDYSLHGEGVMLDILDSGTTTERIVITWDGMSEMLFYYYYPYYYFTQAGNFFQAALYTSTGVIVLSYKGISASDGIVGLSPGYLPFDNWYTVDFDECELTYSPLFPKCNDTTATAVCSGAVSPAPFEWFDDFDHDLDNTKIVFSSATIDDDDGGGTSIGYSFDVYDITCLPDIPTSGAEVLELGDDDNVPIDISAAPFTFYGVSYDKMYVGSNGYVTFDAGDDWWYDNRFQHFEQPRISILMDDLNPVPEWGGGGAFFYQYLDGSGDDDDNSDARHVVTIWGVPEWADYYGDGANYCQIIMDVATGDITFVYLETESFGLDGIIGLSPGYWPGQLMEWDISQCTSSAADLAALYETAYDVDASSSSCGTSIESMCSYGTDDDSVAVAQFPVQNFDDATGAFDLQYRQLYFTNVDDASWTYELDWITCFADVPSAAAMTLDLYDDDYVEVDISAHPFTYYGVEYDTMYVSSNGYITFSEGASGWISSWDGYNRFYSHFALPTIAVLHDDLDPETYGGIFVEYTDSAWVVTYWGICPFYTSDEAYAQAKLFTSSGDIQFSYMAVTGSEDALVGLSAGYFPFTDLYTYDLSECASTTYFDYSNTVCDDVWTASCTGETQVAPVQKFEFLYTEVDLAFGYLKFTPSGTSSYDYEFGMAKCLYDMPGSDAVDAGIFDDDFLKADMGDTFTFYGEDYTDVYIGSNGFVTFEEGDWDYSDNLNDHFAYKRIAVLFDDMDPTEDGAVFYDTSTSGQISVTWWDVPQFGYYGEDSGNYFQATMFFSTGVIYLTYMDIQTGDGLVGLSPGYFPFLNTMTSDLSACTSQSYYDYTEASCASDDNTVTCSAASSVSPVQDLTDSIDQAGEVFDLENTMLVFTPDGAGTGFSFTAQPITCLPYIPGSGAIDLEMWDDDVVDVSAHMAKPVPFYSYSYDSMFVHTNGFITLGESGYYLDGDTDFATDYTESLWDHFTTPRISPLFDDLWAGDQGGVYVEDVAGTDDDEGRFVATWWEVQHYYDYYGASFFQAGISYNTGEVFIAYGALSYVSGGVIGLSPGYMDILDLKLADFSECALTTYYSYANEDGCGHGGQNADDIDDWTSSCSSANTVAPFEIGTVPSSDFAMPDFAIMYTPNSAGSKYKVNRFSVGGECLPDVPSARAERVYLNDDDYAIVDFDYADGFEFYGERYQDCYVGSNGYITFDYGDWLYLWTDGPYDHFRHKRIAALYADLDPGSSYIGGGAIFKETLDSGEDSERLVVTFWEVPEYGYYYYYGEVGNTFQIAMYVTTGTITLTYIQATVSTALVGLSPGYFPFLELQSVDMSNCELDYVYAYTYDECASDDYTSQSVGNCYANYTACAANLDPDDTSVSCGNSAVSLAPVQLFTGDGTTAESLSTKLSNSAITFFPDPATNGKAGYSYIRDRQMECLIETPTSNAVDLQLLMDDYALIDVDGFTFYGETYERAWVSSKAYITFAQGDYTYTENFYVHFNQPRISALFDDMDPESYGGVFVEEFDAGTEAERFAVTWWEVPEYYYTENKATVQIVLYPKTGAITIAFHSVEMEDGLVGLSPGYYPFLHLEEHNFRQCSSERQYSYSYGCEEQTYDEATSCSGAASLAAPVAMLTYGKAPSVLLKRAITFTPDGDDLYSFASEQISCLPDIPSPDAVDLQISSYYTYQIVEIEDGFTFYGVTYYYAYVSMHGYITFGYDSVDYDYSESITEHFKIPRIALIYDQFDIDAGGSIYAETLGESDDDDYRLVITYWDVREVVDTYYGYGYETGASYTMQATLFLQTGVVKMSYSQIKPLDGYTYPSASDDDDCVNSDNGATDPYGDDCDDYTLYPYWCGTLYDDDDFTSNEMCCACSADTESLMGDGAVGLSSGSFPFLDTTMVDFDDCSTASYYSYTYGDLADDSSYSSYCTSTTSYTAPVEIFEALYDDDGSGAEFDLDGLRILFTPDGDSAYSWETWAPDDGSGKRLFDVPSTSAILLDLMDDDYMSVAINAGFTFYGTTYLQAFVGSNGYVSFTGGDLSYTETVSEHFSQPRIAILYDDLNPSYSEGGGVYYEFLDSDDDGEARLVVTFWDVYEYYYENKYTMQAVMYLGSGNIMLSYGRMNAYNYASSSSDDGIVGLSPGYMPFLDLIEADFSECGAAAWYSYDYDCDATQTTVCSAAAATAPVQLFLEGLGEDSTCANTDGDATDEYLDGCDDGYNEYPWWCGGYDDSDFSSNDMCCACGGGAEFTDDDTQGWSEYYFDLAEHEITFSPNSAGSAYAYTVKSNSGCLYDMPSATASALDVDFFDYEAYYMSGGFEFYGEEHYIAYVNSNGYITFGSSDADWFVDWTDNYYDHFDRPRVSLFYDTLYTGGTYQEGVILAEDLSDSAGGGDRTSITFWNIEQAGVSTYYYWGDDTRNFGQVTMFWDTGAVVLSYGRVDLNDALVGLSPGYFPFLDLAQSDFSACTSADYFSFSASDFGATGTAVCTQSSDHIYAEVFEDGVDFDLMYKQITFTPSSDGSGYTYATTTVSALADLPSSAAVDLDLGDDDYSQVGLPSVFSFYGEDYASCYVGSNGYITFGGADWNWDPSWASMFGMPRVAALFTDFAPWEQGGVFYETVGSGTSERLVVTWWQVPHYNCYYLDEMYGSEYVNYCDNYVQASLYTATGKVVLSYMDVTYGLGEALVGLSPGYSEGAKTADYSACTAASYCTNDELCAYAGDAEAAFAFAYTSYTSPFNLENSMVTFMPVSDSTWTYAVNETNCPQETMSAGLSPLPLYDDSYEVVDLGETGFSFYGVTYDSVYVGSNGYLTFGMGDTNYYESLSSHFDQPRISLFFDDLTPASAGGYGGDIYSEMKGTTGAADERLVVTFDGVSQYGTDDGGCYGQAVLWLASGKIQLIYGDVGTSDGVVGLSSGSQPPGIPTLSFLDETMCPEGAATPTPTPSDDSTNSLDDTTNCIGYCANLYSIDDDSLFVVGGETVCTSYKRMLVTCWSIVYDDPTAVECTYEGDAVWNELTLACIETGCTDEQCGIENVDDVTTIVTTYTVQQTVSMSGMSESDFLGSGLTGVVDMSASTISIFKTGIVYASGYSDTITADDVTITAVGSTSVSLRRGLLDADDDAVSVDYEIASDTFTADDASAVADAVSTSVSSGSFSSALSTAAVDLGLTTVYTATLASATATVTASATATTTTTVVVDDYTPAAGQTPVPSPFDERSNDERGNDDNDNSGGREDDGDVDATSGGSEDNSNFGGGDDTAQGGDDMAIIIIVLAIVACLCVGVGVGAGVYLVVFRGKGGNGGGGGSDAAPPMQYNTGVQMTGNLANVAQAVPLAGAGGAMPVKAEPIAGMGVPQTAIVAGGGNVSTRDVLTRAGIAPDRSTAYLRLLHDFPSYDSLAVLSTSDLERLGLQTADARAIAETCKSMAQSGGGGGASRVSL